MCHSFTAEDVAKKTQLLPDLEAIKGTMKLHEIRVDPVDCQIPNMYYKTLSNEDAKPFQLTATGPKKTKVAENPSKDSAAADERVEAADERVEVPVYDSDSDYREVGQSIL